MSQKRALRLSESLEDYLEAVHEVARRDGVVRAKAVASCLGVKASSVTEAVRQLVQRRLARHAPYGAVVLTTAGERRARSVARRHRVLKEFLVRVLGIDAVAADASACHLEHDLPPGAVVRLERLTAFLEAQPETRHSALREIIEQRT